MNYCDILNIPLSIGTLKDFRRKILEMSKNRESSSVYVANVHMCIEAWMDRSFQRVINSADIITPDGMPLVQGLKLLHGIKQERIDGMSLFPELLNNAEKDDLSVFFYGSTPQTLKAIFSRVKSEHCNLRIAGFDSPPFRSLTQSEESSIIKKINDSEANLVFVALGCPKQERWMASMKGRINAVMIGVGGAFPVYAGIQKRAPEWMQKASLEWLFRLYQEPRRLFKRYFITNSLFLFLIIREILSKRFFSSQEKSVR
jgi:N-acetylglucosaminyldiphosphoundecaprenol N-acetyl-beta-D-mannosaminyltransferase